MSETTKCPECGGRMKLSRVTRRGSLRCKRRDCTACGHADRILLREEIAKIIEVTRK